MMTWIRAQIARMRPVDVAESPEVVRLRNLRLAAQEQARKDREARIEAEARASDNELVEWIETGGVKRSRGTLEEDRP